MGERYKVHIRDGVCCGQYTILRSIRTPFRTPDPRNAPKNIALPTSRPCCSYSALSQSETVDLEPAVTLTCPDASSATVSSDLASWPPFDVRVLRTALRKMALNGLSRRTLDSYERLVYRDHERETRSYMKKGCHFRISRMCSSLNYSSGICRKIYECSPPFAPPLPAPILCVLPFKEVQVDYLNRETRKILFKVQTQPWNRKKSCWTTYKTP